MTRKQLILQSLQARLKRLLITIFSWVYSIKESKNHRRRSQSVEKLCKYFGLGACIFVLIVGIDVGYLAVIALTPQVTTATPNSSIVKPSSTEPSQLVQAGKANYRDGQFSAAITVWQEALDLFVKQGVRLSQAVVLSNLSLAHQQLGQWKQANEAIAKSIALLMESEKGKEQDTSRQNLLADALNIQGSLQLAQGQAADALNTWLQATHIYQKVGNKTGVIRGLINQAQALRVQGFYPRAQVTLDQVNQALQGEPDSLLKAASLLNLGDILRVNGDLSKSEAVLKQSLAIAQKLQSKDDTTRALLSLGNNAYTQQHTEDALNYYQQAIATATTPKIKIQAQLNQLWVLVETEKWAAAKTLLAQIQPDLDKIPSSRTAVAARVNFVQSLIKVKSEEKDSHLSLTDAAQILVVAGKQAQELGDKRAEADALGYLGELYLQTQQWHEARRLTEKTLILAQASNASDISYRLLWQLGRIFVAQNKYKEAISAYTEAVQTLQVIRNDIAFGNFELRFSFIKSVEPVYRELVGLLLQPTQISVSKKGQEEVSQTNLKKARELIESLQLAELDYYFREACLKGLPVPVDKIDPQAAVIYPIILRDRLEVILSLPNQSLRHYITTIPQEQIEYIFGQMQASLSRTSLKQERLQVAQKVYDLLIRPAEADLQASKIKTLAFVLDGVLKNLPMAALYDGQQYLIEKYGIAITPGLQLLTSRSLQRQHLKVLLAGVSESTQGFASLPGVNSEVTEIKAEIPAQVLFNQTFTSAAIEKKISTTSFQVVHLATHGQFSSNASDTYILTWDSRLDVKQLGEMLKSREEKTSTPIELLVLSACQSADGDKRAALGLAGVAVRSGARSTMGTLWPVDDKSTATFMVEFYNRLLNSQTTKAEALRQAQLKLLSQPSYNHPFYWAPFVLVGNWL
jgi:CHAT domain-containing protein